MQRYGQSDRPAGRISQQVPVMGGGERGKWGRGCRVRQENKKPGSQSFTQGERIGTGLSPPWVPGGRDPGGQTSRAAFPKCVDSGSESFGCNDCSIKTMNAKCHSQTRGHHAKTGNAKNATVHI